MKAVSSGEGSDVGELEKTVADLQARLTDSTQKLENSIKAYEVRLC